MNKKIVSEPKEWVNAEGTMGHKTLENGKKLFYDIETLLVSPPSKERTGLLTTKLRSFQEAKIHHADKGTTVKEMTDYRAAVHHYTRNALKALLYANLGDEEYKDQCLATAIRLLQELDSKYK